MRHNSVLCELSVAIDPSCRAHVQDNVTFEVQVLLARYGA